MVDVSVVQSLGFDKIDLAVGNDPLEIGSLGIQRLAVKSLLKIGVTGNFFSRSLLGHRSVCLQYLHSDTDTEIGMFPV